MKKIILLLLILITFNFLFSNEEMESKYKLAVENYKQSNFEESLKLFKSIENNNIENADLFLNIGNCYYRLNNLGFSIVYYKKALKINPRFRAAEKNLEQALSLTKDKFKNNKKSVLLNFFKNIFNLFSLNSLAIILLILFVLIIIVTNFLIINQRNKKTLLLFYLTIFVILFFSFSFLSYQKFAKTNINSEGVIIDNIAVGFSGPGSQYTRVFTIHEGMIFDIIESEDDWIHIQLKNGIHAWVFTKKIMEI